MFGYILKESISVNICQNLTNPCSAHVLQTVSIAFGFGFAFDYFANPPSCFNCAGGTVVIYPKGFLISRVLLSLMIGPIPFQFLSVSDLLCHSSTSLNA